MNKYYSHILYLLISIFVVILFINDIGFMGDLQRSLDDALTRMTAAEGPRPNVAVVSIDGRSLDKYGEWPWDRDLVADLTAAIGSGEPSTIVLNFDLYEDPGQDSAGFTDILAGQLSWIDNVVLPYDIALATYRANRTANTKYLFNNSITVNNPLGLMDDKSSLLVRKVFLPAEKLLANQPYLGFDYLAPDDDRVVRRQALMMHYEGYYYPSLPLVAAAAHLNVPPDQISVEEKTCVKLGGSRVVPTNSNGEFFVNFTDGNAFSQYSAEEVLSEDFDHSRLKGAVVLIGLDRNNAYEFFETPVNSEVTDLFITASVIDNIINENILIEKATTSVVNMLILFALGGLFAFVLPRMSLLHRMLTVVGAMFVLANVNYVVVSSMRMLPDTLYIALELLLFAIAAPLLDSELIAGEAKKQQKAAKKPQKRTAADIASEIESAPVRELRTSPNDPEAQETAVLNYDDDEGLVEDYSAIKLDDSEMPASDRTAAVGFDEDGSDATGVIQADPIDEPISRPHIIDAEPKPEPKEVDPNSDLDQVISDSQKLGSGPVNPDITNLGRYQINKVLGKGAMGLVYEGIDPAINRPVALKTIRLDFVNDPEEMEELKERLHREAQAAGKLSHPNIVTIYDVGSEGQLQYIAMEYLEGVTLEDMIKRNTKFNYKIIAQIIMQICSALEYAHDKGIIHRDIKPANIMVLSDYRVKVMDYGIARIDSNSMTKTGIAMGTPNYISPEQLKGLRPDRRADIFSLGVVMYEMLLGRRPFKGENITSLIYSIIHTEPEKPSNINPQIPLIFDRILDLSLRKDPGDRFQRASDVSEALKDFVESFAVK